MIRITEVHMSSGVSLCKLSGVNICALLGVSRDEQSLI